MFKAKPPVSRNGHHDVDTLIGPQTTFQGDLIFTGGLYVEGRIVGTVSAEPGSKAALTLADGGSIEGEIRAPLVYINGTLHGDVHAPERIELGNKARVVGNVHYQVVEMNAGATLTGRLIHAAAEAQVADAPALRVVGGES